MYKGLSRLLVVAVLLGGCAKNKFDTPSNLVGTQVLNGASSSIRLFNFSNTSLDVKVNNIALTAFSADANAQGNAVGLTLFPTNVWVNTSNGDPVTLPASLENKQSAMTIIIRPRTVLNLGNLGSSANFNIDTTLVDDPLNPRDYYVMGNGQLQVIPRNSVAPANPQNFKIRIYNLSAPRDTMGLMGHVTLTYADGTPVNSLLDSVAPGVASPYVEIPYGSYQFKLYVTQPGSTMPDYTKQLTEIPGYPNMTNGVTTVQADLSTLVRGFLPGGTYSILVTPGLFGYDIVSPLAPSGIPTFFLINSYYVLTEQAGPTNTDWARMQGVNALSAQGISFLVDGAAMGSNLSYGQAGDYTVLSKGTHTIQALDASGKVLSQQSFELYPFDNITAWAYMNNGTPALTFSNTDFTSTLYETSASGVVNDGTNGSTNTIQFAYTMQFRFLNLSDVPYATFTDDGNPLAPYLSGNLTSQLLNDTLAYPQAYINLQPGAPVTVNPFVIYPGAQPPFALTIRGQTYLEGLYIDPRAQSNPLPLRVYASQPAGDGFSQQVPGTILTGVPSLGVSQLSPNTQIYAGGTPNVENGFYTVALIGSTAGASGAGPAQLIAVKHNK